MGQNSSSLENGNPCANASAMFYSCKSQFREKSPVFLIETFPVLVLTRNTIMSQHLIIHFALHYLSSGCLQEIKNKGTFQIFSSKINVVLVAYKRFQISIVINLTRIRLVFWKTGP